MKKLFRFAVFMAVFMWIGIGYCFAGEIDTLVNKLIEKGVLTPGEAQQIITETKEEVKKEIAEGKSSSLPQWVQNTKLKGDFRLRYQRDHSKSTTNNSIYRDRVRIRTRLGLESKVNDKILAGIGIATGLSDGSADAARSTNASLEKGFSKKAIAFDYAYAQYAPFSWATFIGGKFKNNLWEPGDLVWDTDINPEGGAVKLTKKINSELDLFLNSGVYVIEEQSASDHDPMMYAIQPGFNLAINDTTSLKGAISYYHFANAKDNLLSGTKGTNTGYTVSGSTVSGRLKYDYREIIPALELSFKEPFKPIGLDLPYIALFGEYVQNVDSGIKYNKGYMLGCKLGAEKVEKWADWQVRYNYAALDRDAILDTLPDSDRYDGKTGMKAHEIMFDWGLAKNTWIGFDFYQAQKIKSQFGSTQSSPAIVA